jgi:putative redox protein
VPRAVARRREGYTHDVEVEGHTLVVDEPEEKGGSNRGSSPTRLLAASLASCKGWDLGEVEVVVDMEFGRSSVPRSFLVTLKLPKELSDQQQQRLGEIAGRCPVHQALSQNVEVSIEDRIELV